MLNRFIFKRSRNVSPGLRKLLLRFYLGLIIAKNKLRRSKSILFESVEIETTSYCNRKCSYCPNSKYKREKGKLSLRYIKKICSELKKLKFTGDITLTGFNEPLMDKRIIKIIKILREYLPKNKIIIYTNGDFLTKELYNRLSKIKVIFNITIHSERKIPKFFNGRNCNLRKEISDNTLSTRGGLVKVKNPEKKTFCIIPTLELTIDYKGNIKLCSDDYFSRYVFGNVKKDKIISVWRDPRFSKIRKDIRVGKMELEICKKCASNY
ncbi:MAG: radical SAM/SPASM domain-containing protein [Nanobdellota archaeon]